MTNQTNLHHLRGWLRASLLLSLHHPFNFLSISVSWASRQQKERRNEHNSDFILCLRRLPVRVTPTFRLKSIVIAFTTHLASHRTAASLARSSAPTCTLSFFSLTIHQPTLLCSVKSFGPPSYLKKKNDIPQPGQVELECRWNNRIQRLPRQKAEKPTKPLKSWQAHVVLQRFLFCLGFSGLFVVTSSSRLITRCPSTENEMTGRVTTHHDFPHKFVVLSDLTSRIQVSSTRFSFQEPRSKCVVFARRPPWNLQRRSQDWLVRFVQSSCRSRSCTRI